MGDFFYKIEQDLKAGKKKKACDRLRNLINQFPDDLSLRNKLGQIYYAAGFIDEAGKYWILSQPENKEMEKAVELYRKTLSNSGNAILKDIVFRGNKAQLNEYATKVLAELEKDSLKKTKHIPDFKPKNREKGKYSEAEDPTSFVNKIFIVIFIVFLILLPILGFFKLLELIKALFSY
ncbi:DUF6584 family protein [Chryseobacterium sp. BIGb0232]|uniref:DUF6584 family protein n=1 Tax=Chryseobacterium sp. BIGb0232 TaxID=2940598 RepID=UPI000F46146E|nr:DUF6584 family protein [Chryseobacterium sp. BIGb0232]MCS4305512.1 tetratricopeptide (TPR) repeat protein [Chryseobacterium sp. BIGb0232]ROS06633.1 hypothetical protein EDF65_5178 [Chryseobacterium nakagawai]